jgi:hypothetical protein
MDNSSQNGQINQPSEPQAPSNIFEKAPKPYQSVQVGKIVFVLVIVMLVSWGIIGGFIAYALNNDVADKFNQVTSDTVSNVQNSYNDGTSTNRSQSVFDTVVKNVKVENNKLLVGDFTFELTGNAKNQWEFIDQRLDIDSDCTNDTHLKVYCKFATLVQKNSNTDVAILMLERSLLLTMLKKILMPIRSVQNLR